MTADIIAILLWALVFTMTIGLRRRRDRALLYAALTVAGSLTLNISGLYLALDGLVGRRNLIELVSDLLLVAGIYFLTRAVRSAATGRVERAPGLIVGGFVAAAVVIVSFFLIDAPYSSTDFMIDFGNQWPAAIYSAAQFCYVGVAMALTAAACFGNAGRMSALPYRVGFRLTGAGCLLAITLVLVILVMDVTHATGLLGVMRIGQRLYDPLYIAAIALLCIGMGIPPVARAADRRRLRRRSRSMLPHTFRIWEDLVQSDADFDALQRAAAGTETAVLHRMYIDIQDELAATQLQRAIPDEDASFLRIVEAHITRQPIQQWA